MPHETKKRFRWPSDVIDIRKLERETLKLLYIGFVISILFHGSVGFYIFSARPSFSLRISQRERAIPVDLVPIPPRLRDQFILQRPDRDQRRVPRRVPGERMPDTTFKGKQPIPSDMPLYTPSEDYTINAPELVRAFMDSIMTADIPEELKEILNLKFYVPERFYQDLTITRDPIRTAVKISLQEELLKPEDFDYGEYMGLVFMKNGALSDIKGFVHIPSTVWGLELRPPAMVARGAAGLEEAMKTYTNILVSLDDHLQLDSPDLMKYPFIYIAADDIFDLTERERENLGNYLRNGGFALVEAYGYIPDFPSYVPKAAPALKAMLRDALGSQGRLAPIPNDDMLYHSFFDFDDGPPFVTKLLLDEAAQPARILEGVWLDGRLVAVYSEKKYGELLSEVSAPEAYKRIGVNMVVHALMQEGGLSMKVVDDIVQSR